MTGAGSGGCDQAINRLAHDRPVLFLIILSVVSVFAVFMIVSPKAIATRLGRRYQETLKEHYECVKTVDSGGGFGGIDPGFTMAIFGVGALAGSSISAPFEQAFPAGKAGGGCGGGVKYNPMHFETI